MNIVVAMKQIPDLQQIRIKDRKPIFDDVVYTYGDLDKNALELAVQLRESIEGDAKVTVLSVGNEELEETVKEALAAGGDEAYLIADDDFDGLGSVQSAALIAEAVKRIGNVDVLLFGEGSGDSYSGQVAGRVAEILGLPQVGYACSVSVEDGIAHVRRALEDENENIDVHMPFVASVTAEANTPRIPKVTAILKAGKKPKEVLDSTDIESDLPESATATLSALAPINDRKGIRVSSAEELAAAIKSENIL